MIETIRFAPTSTPTLTPTHNHFANTPTPNKQNLALQKYARLDQSLFARLVRLGVETVQLDKQVGVRVCGTTHPCSLSSKPTYLPP